MKMRAIHILSAVIRNNSASVRWRPEILVV
jgi:hypothetical protein